MKSKCLMVILILSLTLVIVSSKADADTINVGYFVLKPHTMNGHKGVAIEYFKNISEKMEVSEIQFRLQPLKRALAELEKEKLDAILLLAKNSEREMKFAYPRMPFCKTKPVIAVKASHPLKEVKSVEDILPLKFSNVAKGYRSPMMQDTRLRFEPMHGDDTLSRGVEKVLKGRVDAYYVPDSYSMRFIVMTGEYDSKVRILTLPEHPLGLYTVFSKKSAKKYLRNYESALEKIQKEQPYEDFFKKVTEKYK